jgi:transcriptional regulator GlxA family with amidase domain
VMRLRATLRALDESDAALSDLAAEAGFADQAHASRELRRITGLAPSRLRAALRQDRGGDAAVRLAAAFVRGRA